MIFKSQINKYPCIPSHELTKNFFLHLIFYQIVNQIKHILIFYQSCIMYQECISDFFSYFVKFYDFFWRGSSSPRRIDISATSAEDVSLTYDNQWIDFIHPFYVWIQVNVTATNYIFRFRNIVKMVRKMRSSTITNRRCLMKNIGIIIMYSHTTIYRKDWKLQGKSRKGGGSFFSRSPSKVEIII